MFFAVESEMCSFIIIIISRIASLVTLTLPQGPVTTDTGVCSAALRAFLQTHDILAIMSILASKDLLREDKIFQENNITPSEY